MSNPLPISEVKSSVTLKEVSTSSGISKEAEREIFRALRGLRYGSVEITVHDSQVVQVERREKTRLLRS
jgi:hypothetical protein